jgi:NADH-quinone oxidoreductase subunit L
MSLWLIPCVPAAAAALQGLGGDRRFGGRGAAAIGCAGAGIAVLLSAIAFAQLHGLDSGARVLDETLGQWMPPMPLHTAAGISVLSVTWTLRLDRLSAALLLAVSGFGLLMQLLVAARTGQAPQPNDVRWSSLISVLCAVTLLTLLAGNFFVMFVGWEGLGLCTFLLLPARTDAADADRAGKTWSLVSSAATGALLLAIVGVLFTFGTTDFREVENDAGALQQDGGRVLSAIVILLCAAAAAKTAQGVVRLRSVAATGGAGLAASVFGATMSAVAGIYLVARNLALFEHSPIAVSAISATVFAGVAAATLAVRRIRR